jgi:hypothetical protein
MRASARNLWNARTPGRAACDRGCLVPHRAGRDAPPAGRRRHWLAVLFLLGAPALGVDFGPPDDRLLPMTGSVVAPVEALVLNLLSLTVMFGVLVWGFQEGGLAWLLGFTPWAPAPLHERIGLREEVGRFQPAGIRGA